MKFAIATLAYHEERFVRHFVNHYKELVDRILVLNSAVPWNGPLEAHVDNTAAIAKGLGVDVIQDRWKTEAEQRNYGLQVLRPDFDWVFILDPDEFIEKQTFEQLKHFLTHAPFKAYNAGMMRTYWKKGYVINPPEGHRPLVALKPKEVMFEEKRGTDVCPRSLPENYCVHHFTMARKDEEVWKKLIHFAHATDFNVVEWYRNVWLKWTPEMKDFHPVVGSEWHEAVPDEGPEEFRHLWEGL